MHESDEFWPHSDTRHGLKVVGGGCGQPDCNLAEVNLLDYSPWFVDDSVGAVGASHSFNSNVENNNSHSVHHIY